MKELLNSLLEPPNSIDRTLTMAVKRTYLIGAQGIVAIRHVLSNRTSGTPTKRRLRLWEQLSGNSLLNVVVGFILTGLIGTLLTNHYADRQRNLDEQRLQDRIQGDRLYQATQKSMDIAREERDRNRIRAEDLEQRDRDAKRSKEQRDWEIRRAYMDELNKARVFKIAEVWEKVFIYEAAVSRLTNELALESFARSLQRLAQLLANSRSVTNAEQAVKDPTLSATIAEVQEPYKRLEQKANDVTEIATKNRLWLGSRRYNQIGEYVDMSRALAADLSSPGSKPSNSDLTIGALRRRRDMLRVRFESLRDEIWNE